jgi:GNAT superfamily N-acetyltransferase
MLRVVEVKGPAEVARFFDLADSIYEGDPRWVAPLRLHVRALMGRLGRPDNRFWLVCEGSRPVARLGVRHHRHPGQEALHFGFFECREGYSEAARILFQKAQSLAPHLPLRGPYHFRQEDPYPGLLVDGFHEEPCFLMAYNPPYYDDYLRAAGLVPVKDLYAYEYRPQALRADLVEERARRAWEQGVRVRTMHPWRRAREVRSLAALFNRALADNWGFEEFTEDHIRELVVLSWLLLDPRLVFLASYQGCDVGAAILLPNLNPLLKPGRGRLTPALVWRYLFHRHRLRTYRGFALGVLPEYRHLDVTAALLQAAVRAGQTWASGWEAVEVAWVLADNRPMNALARALGGRRSKTWRLFERACPEAA